MKTLTTLTLALISSASAATLATVSGTYEFSGTYGAATGAVANNNVNVVGGGRNQNFITYVAFDISGTPSDTIFNTFEFSTSTAANTSDFNVYYVGQYASAANTDGTTFFADGFDTLVFTSTTATVSTDYDATINIAKTNDFIVFAFEDPTISGTNQTGFTDGGFAISGVGTVPEPSSAALLGLGGLALLSRRKR